MTSDSLARPASQSAPPTSAPSTRRIMSLDVIRGVVMILMALDHVRVFSGVPAGGPTPGVFFTRWMTNFVAPAFVFLAGTGAFLYGRRVGSRRDLARFLAIRGAWLVLLELTFLRVAWTFNFDYSHYVLAGVIWMLGWCMILLAGLLWLPTPALAAVGLIIIAGHNVMDLVAPVNGDWALSTGVTWLWQILYFGGPVQLGAEGSLAVLYSIVPWIGVMAAGYAFGQVMEWPPERRRRFCFQLGGGAVLLFLVLRVADVYGDPRHWANAPVWHGMPAPLRFLATSKYPASLLFLLMTLGPMVLAIPLLEKARGKAADVLATYGRVPLFFYLLHIPLIHALALVVSFAREGSVNPWLFLNHPMMVPPAPDGYTWSLPLLYLMTAVAVVILYIPCRWFARLKNSRRLPWLSFL